MKAKTILFRNDNQLYMYVEFEEGKTKRVDIPVKLSKHPAVIEDGKLKIGRYTYNESTDTWDKISKILLFLQSIVEAIKNIFQ